MTCPFAHDDGAYVLGSLSPVERLEFERHLTGCDDCTLAVRSLAGLPGLLGRVDASVLEHETDTEPAPDTLLPRLLEQVRAVRRRRHRAGLVLAAAAAGVIAALGVAVATDGPSDDPSAVGPGQPTAEAEPMQPVGDVPVRAELTMEQVTWGTRLGLTCTYDTGSVPYELPAEVDYLLVVRTSDGGTEKVGSWRSVDGRTMQLTAATAADRDDISSVEVRAPGGRVVLRLTA